MNEYLRYRFLEIIPGALTWGTIIGAIILSFVKPLWLLYFIIIFDLYWVFRVCYFIFFLLSSWRRYRRDGQENWLAKLKTLSNWENKVHLIFLPTYKEPITVLRQTFDDLIKTKYPLDKFIVVLAGEGRDEVNFLANAKIIKEKYGSYFRELIVTVHPPDLPGEIQGKGSNLNYAGHIAQKIIDRLKISYDSIIVSALDVDSRVHQQYFAYLTFLYCTVSNPTRASYQPVVLFNNNIWRTNPVLRISAFGTVFWLMAELSRPERLFTFSSHSMSWRALVDVGFWQKNIVSEDSRIFLQCFLRYGGDYRVEPMYVSVSMHTAAGDTFWESLKNLYYQQRRWAWGVEHFPFMVWHFSRHKSIPLAKKITYLWNQAEGMYSWATVPILIFILGRLPLWLTPPALRASAFYQNTPFTLEVLMNLAMSGVLASAILSLLLLPPPPRTEPIKRWVNYLVMALQWLLLPLTFTFFGAVPAIDAQTRLMFGRYLGFYVTKKTK